jgi:hypothetical protein
MSERCPNCGSRHKRAKGFGAYCGNACKVSHEKRQGSNPDGSTSPADVARLAAQARNKK